jgi:hypothetical protein
MKNGKCPKCGASSVYTRQYKLSEILGNVAGRLGEKDDYVCTDCGYYEEYIVDKGALQKVKEKWKRVG